MPQTSDITFLVGRTRLRLNERTYIMGVLNVTPDSFSDGGDFIESDRALRRALEMEAEGADIIDVGGESTRPGADEVGADEEAARVAPVIKAAARRVHIPISIDTRKARVAIRAIEAGARIVNDVSGLSFDPEMASVIARRGASVILMHSKGSPKNMQLKPRYKDLIGEIVRSLKGSIETAVRAGVPEEKIAIDPGIGFGKTAGHNLEILRRLQELAILGRPVCIGTSRKSFIGKALGIDDPRGRLSGSLASSVVAIINGANLLRVHDVKEAVQAARMTDAILRAQVS